MILPRRDAETGEFGPARANLATALSTPTALRPRLLRAFRWVPIEGETAAAAFLELEILDDDGDPANNPDDLMALSFVIATDGGAGQAPQLGGMLTNVFQTGAAIAAQPGRVFYRGPAVYNLGVSRRDLCAWQARVELWGAASPARTLRVKGSWSLTLGLLSDRSVLARLGGVALRGRC